MNILSLTRVHLKDVHVRFNPEIGATCYVAGAALSVKDARRFNVHLLALAASQEREMLFSSGGSGGLIRSPLPRAERNLQRVVVGF